MEHREILLAAIDSLLGGQIDVPEFRRRYYDYYIDVLPEWALSDHERAFFGAVQEKLDWTDEKPDELSRRAGWIDFAEFKAWLSEEREAFAEQ